MTYTGIDGAIYPHGYADTVCAARRKIDLEIGRSARFSFHVARNNYQDSTFCIWCTQYLVPTGKRGMDIALGHEIDIYAVMHVIEEEPSIEDLLA